MKLGKIKKQINRQKSSSLDNLKESLDQAENIFCKDYQGVMVCCSGGPDSTALFHLLYEALKNKKKFPMAICHVNFGLRKHESDRDQNFIEDLARRFQVPFHTYKVTAEERKNKTQPNTQLWAREVRYRYFKDFIHRGWLIALGHTQDDLAENLIMRISKGHSPASAAGMQELSPPYWRPLLNTPKNELLKWLTRKNLPFCHDSSNDKLIYNRNTVRHKIIPELEKLFPGAQEKLARFAQETHELSLYVEKELSRGTTAGSLDAYLDVEKLVNLPNAVSYKLLGDYIRKQSNQQIKPSHNKIQHLTRLLKENEPACRKVHLSSDFECLLKGNLLKVQRRQPKGKQKRLQQHKASLLADKASYLLGNSGRLEYDITKKNSDPHIEKTEGDPTNKKATNINTINDEACSLSNLSPKINGKKELWLVKDPHRRNQLTDDFHDCELQESLALSNKNRVSPQAFFSQSKPLEPDCSEHLQNQSWKGHTGNRLSQPVDQKE